MRDSSTNSELRGSGHLQALTGPAADCEGRQIGEALKLNVWVGIAWFCAKAAKLKRAKCA